jgi:orotate phosphoribosyltransferase
MLGKAIAERTRELRPTVVLSPALGGVVIGHEVGRALGVRAIFAERQDGALALRRGFMVAENDRVLVVEDVFTTGGSTRETIQVAKAAGGQVVGAASIVDGRDRLVTERPSPPCPPPRGARRRLLVAGRAETDEGRLCRGGRDLAWVG